MVELIDPKAVTDYTRSDRDLQHFWLFSMAVAGKNADKQAEVVSKIMKEIPENVLPFDYLRRLGDSLALRPLLEQVRIGQYARLTRAITESLSLDLRQVTADQLDDVYGVGLKTAKFFLLHSRPALACAVLDTHVLTWLNSLGIGEFPDTSPQSPIHYKQIERLFLPLAMAYFPGMSFAEIDLHLWNVVSGRHEILLPTLHDMVFNGGMYLC